MVRLSVQQHEGSDTQCGKPTFTWSLYLFLGGAADYELRMKVLGLSHMCVRDSLDCLRPPCMRPSMWQCRPLPQLCISPEQTRERPPASGGPQRQCCSPAEAKCLE